MDEADRLKRVRHNRRSDLETALWGAAPVALASVELDKTKDLLGAVPGPAGKVISGTRTGWKEIQEALGKGARRVGVDHALEILGSLSRSDGSLARDTVEGAKDALLGNGRRGTSPDYRRAYRMLARLTARPPADQETYPRTEDGFRGGLIAGTAVKYADVTGDPMLGRVQRAVLKTQTAKWSPGNVVFGSGASLSGSILDAVKHITESATDDTDSAANQVGEAKEAIEKWRSLLDQLGTMAGTRGPDEATSAAKQASNHAEDAARLARDASHELKGWERDL
ncbi:MAG: hypothetical protein ACRDTJ_21170 [Pseudonocardiaceae bacterium]